MQLICKQFAKISFTCEQKNPPSHEKNFSLPNHNFGLEITCKPQTTQFSKPGSRIRLFQIRLPHTTQFSKPGKFEQSNSTVPNQTNPYHAILQTTVNRGMRPLSLHKKRLKVGPLELCPKMAVHAMMVCEKKQTFKMWCSFCDKALSSKYVYSLEDYKHNLISIIGSFFNIQHAILLIALENQTFIANHNGESFCVCSEVCWELSLYLNVSHRVFQFFALFCHIKNKIGNNSL